MHTSEDLQGLKTVIGLDIGDGESAIAYVEITEDGDAAAPARIYLRSRTRERSVITAMGRSTSTGRRLLGEEAVSATGAVQFSVNFKRPPVPGEFTTSDPVLFAQALLDEFFRDTGLPKDDCVVYVGHPTGWPQDAVSTYARQFETLGLPVRLAPESHSALVHVRDRRTTGRDQQSRALIIDIGSSTTDCTLVDDLAPYNLDLGSDLGCRQIDHELADLVTAAVKDPSFRTALAFDGGTDLLLLACRRVKEAHFAKTPPKLLAFGSGTDPRFDPIVDQAFGWLRAVEISELAHAPGGWADRFRSLLIQVRERTGDVPPDLVVLSGGGSRMGFTRTVAQEIFPEAVVEDDPEPAFSVARGLASNGRHRRNITLFRQEVAALARDVELGPTVESLVTSMLAEVKSTLGAIDDLETARMWVQELTGENAQSSGIDVETHRQVFNESIIGALTPRTLEICTRYGIEDYAVDFVVTLPRLIIDELVSIVGDTARRSDEDRSRTIYAGREVAGGALKRYRYAKDGVAKPTKMDNAGFALAAIVIAAGAAEFAQRKYTERRIKRAPTGLDIESLRVEPQEIARFVEAVREQLATQLNRRAEEVERFLA